jgi:Transcription mediator complex subunit Med12
MKSKILAVRRGAMERKSKSLRHSSALELSLSVSRRTKSDALFPPTKELSTVERETWLRQLASSQTSLAEMSEYVPYRAQGSDVHGAQLSFDELADRQVPMLRAVWYLKVGFR